MIQAIGFLPQIQPAGTSCTIPRSASTAPSQSIQDCVQLNSVQKGAIPATLDFAASSPGSQTVDNALSQLQSDPTQENFRHSQAGFRVAIRSIQRSELDTATAHIHQRMKETSDYRTQVFLDDILADVDMEIFEREHP